MNDYASGFGFPQDVNFDKARALRTLGNKWFFVGTRGDVPKPRDYFNFQLFDDQFFFCMALMGSSAAWSIGVHIKRRGC